MKLRLDGFEDRANYSGILEPFEFARRVYHHWDDRALSQIAARVSSSASVGRTIMELCVAQLRSLRSVAILCAEADANSAIPIVRVMLQQALDVGFILAPKWEQKWTNKKSGVSERLKPSPEDRALLVRMASELSVRDAEADPSTLKELVGTQWTTILLAAPYTASGLSIHELAKKLGDQAVHLTQRIVPAHRANSTATLHPLTDFLVKNELGEFVGMWTSRAVEDMEVLLNAVEATLLLFQLIDQNANLGGASHMLLDSFAKELESLREEA